MDWEFNKEHLDQIFYAMENQAETFFLDISSGVIMAEPETGVMPASSRYHELPTWRSLEGFQLMEQFVGAIRNPIFREELREALSSGSGVFRSFKTALQQRKELEKLWYAFKEREMTKVVYDWFNQIREIEGLESLTPPSEEEATEELIKSDFAITADFEKHLDSIYALDRLVFQESCPSEHEEMLDRHYKELRESEPAMTSAESVVIVAETPGETFAGFARGTKKQNPLLAGTILELQLIAVVQEFQGLGLGQALLKKFVEKAEEAGAATVRITLTGRYLNVVKLFQLKGFKVTAQTMDLDLTELNEDDDC